MIVAADIQKTLELELIHAGSNKRLNIEFSDINRPGLQLAGFWDYFPHERPQVLGKVEMTYLEQLEPLLRYERLKRFMSYNPPCVIICRSIRCPQMGRGRSPRACRGSGTSSCRPVSVARGASGGTRRIRSRSPFTR